jgi:hypothetical protein
VATSFIGGGNRGNFLSEKKNEFKLFIKIPETAKN